ncbi:glucose-1-phosphate thymidylyltransferase RfbA [Aquiluna borgnonia]|uniref:Glucose-1-phosphate thymidylyltransferase n=1 Tax=Aquiluna borgnonia TaxID=2499157 RepID=A0A7D4TIQ8_9MICO|nr:glucose-1-phosphate thymidylyltransferase RfbA [Aquiluna borgnonia]QKJ25051.1 glucose-1-phosphate thymidylyltransferase RfbA [Aquiluna borgnonia]
MRGIILAGGSGTRLHPLTIAVSKQLLPVYNKPMVYYPLSTLILAGARQIMIITSPRDVSSFRDLLGDGSDLGIELLYKIQDEPRGIAEGLLLSADFADGEPTALILGDNIFYGAGVGETLETYSKKEGATILVQSVTDPERYGVIELRSDGSVKSLAEKPPAPKSNLAITGLYFLDGTAAERAKLLKPSDRGELEIVDVLNSYLHDGLLEARVLPRGTAWLDTGTFDSMSMASEFVRVVEQRQGFKISAPEEIAFRLGLIDSEQLIKLAEKYSKSDYGVYLRSLIG